MNIWGFFALKVQENTFAYLAAGKSDYFSQTLVFSGQKVG